MNGVAAQGSEGRRAPFLTQPPFLLGLAIGLLGFLTLQVFGLPGCGSARERSGLDQIARAWDEVLDGQRGLVRCGLSPEGRECRVRETDKMSEGYRDLRRALTATAAGPSAGACHAGALAALGKALDQFDRVIPGKIGASEAADVALARAMERIESCRGVAA